jgi:DNA helicase-2/ATP-dependent DNA helicase PcrA
LREQAPAIGLSEQFTIADRSDAEDLLAIVRQQLGFAAKAKRFPLKATCLAIYSRAVNSRESSSRCWRNAIHGAWAGKASCASCSAPTCEKQRQQLLDYDDLLLAWHAMLQAPAIARELARASARAGRRVPGHQPAAGGDPARAQARGRG